jgi:general secretion pathway protein L
MQLTLDQLRIGKLPALLRRFEQWWLKEFLDLFPERVVEFFAGRQQMSLVLGDRDETVTLELLSGSRAAIGLEQRARSTDVLADVDQFLKTHGIDRKDVEVGLRLPADSVFSRQLRLPAEAADAVDAIVAQDLARKTPFRPADIYCDHVVLDHGAKDRKSTVWQWVIRRKYVEQALLSIGIEIGAIKFIVFDGTVSGQPEPLISLRSRERSRSSWWHRAVAGLCGCALWSRAACRWSQILEPANRVGSCRSGNSVGQQEGSTRSYAG